MRCGGLNGGVAARWSAGTVYCAATAGLYWFLLWARGSSPGLDAVTTALSLVAQWMLNRKYLENWLVWIAADVLYVYLYITRELYLTAGLYALFLVMCVAGYVSWRRSLRVV